jgi:hypothetical protein
MCGQISRWAPFALPPTWPSGCAPLPHKPIADQVSPSDGLCRRLADRGLLTDRQAIPGAQSN